MKRHRFYFKNKLKIAVNYFFIAVLLKFVSYSLFSPVVTRQRCLNLLNKNLRKKSFVKLRKFCTITGRLRFIIVQSPFSRITFRELGSKGWIFGIHKNTR